MYRWKNARQRGKARRTGDAHQFGHPTAAKQNVEHQQGPRQVHCREGGAKVKRDDHILVALRPRVPVCVCVRARACVHVRVGVTGMVRE